MITWAKLVNSFQLQRVYGLILLYLPVLPTCYEAKKVNPNMVELTFIFDFRDWTSLYFFTPQFLVRRGISQLIPAP